MSKVLLSPSSFGKISNEPVDLLKNNNFEIIDNPYGRKLTEEETTTLASGCIGIIAGVESLSEKVLKTLPDLKIISRVGVGMDSVDLEYAKKTGISVVNTPDGPTLAVAELTLGLTMSLLRRIPMADSKIKSGVWQKETGNLLAGKTIGVIGLGRIGKKVAEIFRALGNTVIGYDLFTDQDWANKYNVKYVELEEVLKNSDIVSLHVSGSKGNNSLLGKHEIDLMKKGAFLVNVSRGGVVNEAALYESLKNKKLGGAAIDVFEKEPYSGELTTLENVVLTPHLGSYASEAKIQMEIDAVKNFLDCYKKL